MSNRLNLYKNTGRAEAARIKRICSDVLREKRFKKFQSFREMESGAKNNVLEAVCTRIREDVGDLDENGMLELYESVTKILMQEQYDEILRLENEKLAADIEDFLNPSVYCPACLHSPLIITGASAKCQICPFVHNFSKETVPPTPSELRRFLSEGFLTHEATECTDQPSPITLDGKLLLSCSDCGFQTVII